MVSVTSVSTVRTTSLLPYRVSIAFCSSLALTLPVALAAKTTLVDLSALNSVAVSPCFATEAVVETLGVKRATESVVTVLKLMAAAGVAAKATVMGLSSALLCGAAQSWYSFEPQLANASATPNVYNTLFMLFCLYKAGVEQSTPAINLLCNKYILMCDIIKDDLICASFIQNVVTTCRTCTIRER